MARKNENEFVDWIEFLTPIIDDVKDGEKKNLTKVDVDFIMAICRAKIEFKEGLINEEIYNNIINKDYE